MITSVPFCSEKQKGTPLQVPPFAFNETFEGMDSFPLGQDLTYYL